MTGCQLTGCYPVLPTVPVVPNSSAGPGTRGRLLTPPPASRVFPAMPRQPSPARSSSGLSPSTQGTSLRTGRQSSGSQPLFALLAVMWAYPVWWLLGLSAVVWFVLAAFGVAWLIGLRRAPASPPWLGAWLLFLGWVVVSGLMVTELNRLAAAVYRGGCYLAAGVLLLLVLNQDPLSLVRRRLTLAMTVLWGWATGLAVVALIIPGLQVTSPVEVLLPSSAAQIPFVQAMIHPSFGNIDPLLGIVRPRPLFPYTNNWGSAVGLLTPVVVYSLLAARRRDAKILLSLGLAISFVPVVMSVNRGLWISLAVGVTYVLVRLVFRGRLGALLLLAALTALVTSALVLTPLGVVVDQRLQAPNTDTRETLYRASVELVARSPVIGFGAPTSSAGLYDSNSASIGTHGQVWTVLVSHGYPGAALFVGFIVALVVTTWGVSDRMLWLHSVLVVLLVQLPFYDPLPAGLCVAFICAALCLREGQRAHPPGRQAALRPVMFTSKGP